MVLQFTLLHKFNTIYIYEYGCLSCLCFNWFHIWILRECGILMFAIPTYLDCFANYRVLLSNVGPRPPVTATQCNESTLMGLFGSHLVSHFISWFVMIINVILYNMYARYYTIIAFVWGRYVVISTKQKYIDWGRSPRSIYFCWSI